MSELFILAILGHCVGDYMLQSKYMALHKSDPSWKGMMTCTLHVTLYTTAVCAFLWTVNPLVIALVFIPHWVIDRWSLASVWLKMIHGRTFEAAHASTDQYRAFDISFTSIVYTVVDNTMHAISLWFLIRFVMI